MPGFTAKKLDFTSPSTLREKEITQNNSLESKDFVGDAEAEADNKRALSTHRVKNGQAFISIETSSVDDVNHVPSSVATPSGASELIFTKRIVGIKPHQ